MSLGGSLADAVSVSFCVNAIRDVPTAWVIQSPRGGQQWNGKDKYSTDVKITVLFSFMYKTSHAL